MSALSRGGGLFLRPAPSFFTSARRCCSCNSSSPFFRAALRIQRLSRPRRPFSYSASRTRAAAAAAQTATTTVNSAAAALSLAEQLARKKGATALYEAPSHTWFRFSCFSAGLFCMSYATYNYAVVILKPPEGLAQWTVAAFGIIVVFMGAMGAYFVNGAGGIVRFIRAVPGPVPLKRSSRAIGAAGSASSSVTAAARQQKAFPIHLEIGVSRLIPFLKPKVLHIEPTELELPARLSSLRTAADDRRQQLLLQQRHGSVDPRRLEIAEAAARRARQKAEAEYDRNHLMTAPFRHLAKGAREAWSEVKRALIRDGFVKIRIKARGYKLDLHGGWALDEGRPLDRLATIDTTTRSIRMG